ncbi:MAG: thioredoxin family protein [Firmicutes bacterium]|nr:thioredoxin family protein [Bacillota bacterium]
MPVPVSPKNFDAEVLESKLPVLVDFFGERCMPCHMLRPILLALGEDFAGRLKLCMFNTDRERRDTPGDYDEKFRLLEDYDVRHLPTMLLFTGGKLRRALVGLHTRQELLDILEEEGLSLQPGVGGKPGPGESQHGGEDKQGDE